MLLGNSSRFAYPVRLEYLVDRRKCMENITKNVLKRPKKVMSEMFRFLQILIRFDHKLREHLTKSWDNFDLPAPLLRDGVGSLHRMQWWNKYSTGWEPLSGGQEWLRISVDL